MNRKFSSDPDDQISSLIAGLPRVSAPADFDLRLRGRIARQRSAPASGFRLPAALAYALGLGVVLVAFGLFGIAYIYSGKVGDVDAVPTIAKVPVQPVAPSSTSDHVTAPVPEVQNQTQQQAPAVSSADVLRAAVKAPAAQSNPVSPRTIANTANVETSPSPAAGAVPVQALKTSRTVNPQGINPPAANTAPVIVPTAAAVDAKEVLAVYGVNAALSGGKMRIGSVNAGSAAEVAGLKAGDVVESIDDKAVGTSFPGGFTAKTISVIRDGKTVKISIGK